MTPAATWAALAALLGAGALGAWFAPAHALDWQPALAWREPWRWLSAAFVHWSALHLGANLAGCAVVGAFGVAARLPHAATAAWLAAWPLTHGTLLARPDLVRYGGLSGVLHAGVAVAATWLVIDARGRARAVGAVVLAGLALKVLLEAPWGAPLRAVAGWDIALAPLVARALAGPPLRST